MVLQQLHGPADDLQQVEMKTARLLPLIQLAANHPQVLLPLLKLEVEVEVKVVAEANEHRGGEGEDLGEVHEGLLSDTVSYPA